MNLNVNMKESKWLTVMKALNLGLPVTFPHTKLNMVMGVSEDGRDMLCWEMYNYDTKEPVLMSADVEINHFIKWCEEMSDNDIEIMGANIALNMVKQQERKKRDG